MDKEIKRFNIRVYGVLIDNNKVLVTDENRMGMEMTKFPGGGLEKGEGLEDCLKREFLEELNLEVEFGDLFYVNEFFQRSIFREEDQLISFYFKVSINRPDLIEVVEKSKRLSPHEQQFRWVDLNSIDPEMFTFPIDKIVAGKLAVSL